MIDPELGLLDFGATTAVRLSARRPVLLAAELASWPNAQTAIMTAKQLFGQADSLEGGAD